MTEFSNWKCIKHRNKHNAMKTSQETTSVWNNNQVEPYFFACTNWIYDFLNGDHNMDPKMGPHLSLKTGTEKVKANSRASLFPPHFVIAKTDPKTRPSFGQWPKKGNQMYQFLYVNCNTTSRLKTWNIDNLAKRAQPTHRALLWTQPKSSSECFGTFSNLRRKPKLKN
jgi:hypothetical protein